MLSKSTLNALILSIKLINFVKAYPYQWDKKKRELTHLTDWKSKFLLSAGTAFLVFRLIFVSSRCLNSFVNLNAATAPYAIMQLMIVAQTAMLTVVLVTHKYTNSPTVSAQLINHLIRMDSKLTCKSVLY